MLSGFFQNQTSTSGTLSSNTIPNPKGEMKAIITRSGVAYDGPSIPTPKKVMERETEETTDKEQTNFQVNDEPITFNLNQTTRYSSTYDDMSVNQIDIIDVAREEYAQEMLGFSNNSSCGNPTSTSEPIISDSFPSLTPFEGSDFILDEIEAYLKNESISPEITHVDCDLEGDICLIEKLLNDDPFQLPSMDLKQGELIKAKSLMEEPLELELKDLPSHLEYAYLEGIDKSPMIIAKDLKVDKKISPLKGVKCGGDEKKELLVESRVLIPETTFVGVESRVLIPEMTYVDIESRIFLGKLKARWLGPFTITKVFPNGTVELSQPEGPNFKVNGHRMWHYFGGDIPQLVVSDLQTFLMDK
nr:reverse transcriptase domain-containing protein [Tanacetum cinerariifolium]